MSMIYTVKHYTLSEVLNITASDSANFFS